jgi:membrane protease YdiL (CAAX protease family)
LVFTNEPSTQEAPLSTESGGLPEQPLNEPLEPVASAQSARDLPWIKLLIAIATWFGSVLLLLFVPAIIAIPYLVYLWRIHALPNAQALTSDKTFIFISIAGIVPTHLLTLLLVWIVVTEGRKRPFWKTIGFEWPTPVKPVLGMLVCFLIAIVLLGIGFAVTSFWGGGKTQLDMLVESSIAARLATAFVAVFTAPLVEELVYRGVLYSAIERALGTGVAIAAVSLLFAGVHVFQYVNNLSVITVITLLSITLTLVRAYSGKVLPSFMIHLVFNGIQSIIIALSPFTGWGESS